MRHDAQEWYDQGRAENARWLIIEWNARDREFEARFGRAETRPEKTHDGSWHVHAVIDLHQSLDEQPVELKEEP